MVARRLAGQGLDPGHVKRLTRRLDLKTIRIGASGGEREDRGASALLSIILLMMLYTTVIMWGQVVMTSVIEEKTSRVVEVMVSSMPVDAPVRGQAPGRGRGGPHAVPGLGRGPGGHRRLRRRGRGHAGRRPPAGGEPPGPGRPRRLLPARATSSMRPSSRRSERPSTRRRRRRPWSSRSSCPSWSAPCASRWSSRARTARCPRSSRCCLR